MSPRKAKNIMTADSDAVIDNNTSSELLSSRRSSKRSSPRKEQDAALVEEPLVSVDEADVSDLKTPKRPSRAASRGKSLPDSPSKTREDVSISKPALKLRLTMKPKTVSVDEIVEITAPAAGDSDVGSNRKVPKLRLNLSKSSSIEEAAMREESAKAAAAAAKKRGRPKKDRQAIQEAAFAASLPNAEEDEERRNRRRRTEEKIRQSASMESVTSVASEVSIASSSSSSLSATSAFLEMEKRRGRKMKSFDSSLTSSSGQSSLISSYGSLPQYTSIAASAISGGTGTSAFETDFVQRSKASLNITLQHDTFLFNSTNPTDARPFTSLKDAVDRLVPFHLGILAGQYSDDEAAIKGLEESQSCANSISERLIDHQNRFSTVIHEQCSKKVSTELLLLEQRLCLEEEKFLLVKLKNEYAARYMGSLSASSGSRPTTPSNGLGRSNSVVNE